ncbi:hypothetical protein C0J29_08820 [Mycobacterium paragordonae]|jgi:hypothetical protein|uniref:Uncharacterized protein n=1 Tax=Mycobacterium paragordonae TaxID=1389713 RepID=A0A386U2X8_9MYCO|nr:MULTISPECIES: hypothetical protein [Mycobacterium]AYE94867.1 hypothetical protein C0J29_08820 [Mycobacterium paragordonae]MDP7736285.1 hypothetical protein [Mycobacterium paragordonae]OBJ81009.1 hypothetical protein A9W97_26350 [Mycobacterium gordonae]TDK99596.1 hypothetical protein EUA02_06485 [Mycobacterium paragordonae]TDL06052.1 hypothetical protein EUA05_17105 [Mycobacterium paragordonae]
MERLRRVLGHQVSVGALIELAIWMAIPYLVVGFGWAFVHPGQVEQIEMRIAKVMPVGADLAAFGATALLWPASLELAEACH